MWTWQVDNCTHYQVFIILQKYSFLQKLATSNNVKSSSLWISSPGIIFSSLGHLDWIAKASQRHNEEKFDYTFRCQGSQVVRQSKHLNGRRDPGRGKPFCPIRSLSLNSSSAFDQLSELVQALFSKHSVIIFITNFAVDIHSKYIWKNFEHFHFVPQ